MGGGLLSRLSCSQGRRGHGAAREDTQGAKVRPAAEVSRGFRVNKPVGLQALLRPAGPKCLGRVDRPPTGPQPRPAVLGVGSRRSGLRPLARVFGEGQIAPSRTAAPRCARLEVRGVSENLGCTITAVRTRLLNQGVGSTPFRPRQPCAAPHQVLIVLRSRCPIEMRNASFIGAFHVRNYKFYSRHL